MESSSSRRLSRIQTHTSITNREKFVSKRIAPAILGKSCPICLRHIEDRRAAVIAVCMHAYCIECIHRWSNLKRKCPLCNADFDSWFFKINLSSRTFHKEQLPSLNDPKNVNIVDVYGRRTDLLTEQRIIRRSREELSSVSCRTGPIPRRRSFGRLGSLPPHVMTERVLQWRSRIIRRSREELSSVSCRTGPIPRRRSFGRLGSLPPHVMTERVLQWRSSIYEQHLQAVPCSSRSCLKQNVAGKNGVKERILERIEPWIRRELQAILGDPDPSIIVHVATSLFISTLEENHRISSVQSGVDDYYLEPLRPFLLEQTNMFWHELRCYAESSFNMETYDTVVEYTKQPD